MLLKKARTAADGSPLPFGLSIKIFGSENEACIGHDGGGPGIESTLRIYHRNRLVIAVLGSTDGYGADAVAEYLKNILSARQVAEGEKVSLLQKSAGFASRHLPKLHKPFYYNKY